MTMNTGKSMLLCLLLIMAMPAFAQEESEPVDTDAADEPAEAAEEEALEDDEAIVEDGLDQQGFEKEDDDDFIPTEEVGSDQSIPFPTDI